MSPESVWSDIAAWYDELIDQGSGPHETAVRSLIGLLPDLAGQRVLDLACGQGLATRALAAAGAAGVVGIDRSQEMLKIAAARTDPGTSIAWRVDDAERLSTCERHSFDGATCQLALMDIPDLDSALRAIRGVLKSGGWFVFVIGHPCFLAPHAATVVADGEPGRLVSRYLEPEFWRSSNSDGVRGRAGNHHRPLGIYLNALSAAGFRLEAVDEPHATALLAEQQPVFERVPIFFSARAIAI